jgi:hypothetical protein
MADWSPSGYPTSGLERFVTGFEHGFTVTGDLMKKAQEAKDAADANEAFRKARDKEKGGTGEETSWYGEKWKDVETAPGGTTGTTGTKGTTGSGDGKSQPNANDNLKYYNFGNIKSTSGGWRVFDSEEDGAKAVGDWLTNAQTNHGLTTIRQLVERYAPSSDPGNAGKNLPEAAAKIVGVSPDAKVDMSDEGVRRKMVGAIVQQEFGGKPGVVDRALAAYDRAMAGTGTTTTTTAGGTATTPTTTTPTTTTPTTTAAVTPALKVAPYGEIPAAGEVSGQTVAPGAYAPLPSEKAGGVAGQLGAIPDTTAPVGQTSALTPALMSRPQAPPQSSTLAKLAVLDAKGMRPPTNVQDYTSQMQRLQASGNQEVDVYGRPKQFAGAETRPTALAGLAGTTYGGRGGILTGGVPARALV